jgi:two-component sensor histidine kinase
VSSQDSADRVRESALQTASSILSLQRRVDEEIRALNKALQQRSEELATANIELQRQTETAHAQARAFAEKIGLALQRSPADPARR